MTYGTALKQLWTDKCTVFTAQKTTDANGITSASRNAMLTNEPCRISFVSSCATLSNGTTELQQSIKLFLRCDAVIPPGSRIDVTRGGVTTSYRASDPAARYSTHQEIGLTLVEERA